MAFGMVARAARLVVAVSLALSTMLTIQASARAGGISDDDGIETSASIEGSVCPIENGTCAEFEHSSPDLVRTYSATDQREADGDRSKAEIRFDEVYGADNRVRSITVTGRLENRNSGGGRVVASADFGLDIDDITTTITVSGNASGSLTGSELVVSDLDFNLEMECGEEEPYEVEAIDDAGASEPNSGGAAVSISRTFNPVDESCELSIDAFIDASTNRPAPGESGSSDLTWQVTITFGEQAQEGCNGVHGTVLDGTSETGHRNMLRGVRVELRRDGSRVGNAESTDANGAFCLESFAGVVDPGTYQLRATLVDDGHQPPLFDTRYRGVDEPAFTEVAVTADSFSPDRETDVEFAPTAAQPWLPDVANIHYQTERFARWVVETLQIPPSTLGTVKVVTFNNTDTSSFYDDSTSPPTVAIKEVGNPGTSTFAARDEPTDFGPDNAEWHEYAHHVGEVLDIGSIHTEACRGREPHDGWKNATTCDSLAEGFAMFLPVLASQDLDPGSSLDYATFFNAEDNGFYPWSASADGSIQREDFAVAQLLWDLADGGVEGTSFAVLVPPNDDFNLVAEDRVAIGGPALVQLLAASQPDTIADIHDQLSVNLALPIELRQPSVQIDDADAEPDASQLDAVFLAHGFHPVRDVSAPALTFGDPFGLTDHLQQGPGLVLRRTTLELPSSNVLLRNTGGSPVEMVIEVTYPTTSSRFAFVVPAASEKLVYLEVPPPWRQVLPPGRPVPPCTEVADDPVSIRISAPGAAPRDLTSCQYHHLVAVGGAAALTYEPAGAGPGATGGPGAPGPTAASGGPPMGVVVGLAALLVVLLGALAFVLLRQRSGPA